MDDIPVMFGRETMVSRLRNILEEKLVVFLSVIGWFTKKVAILFTQLMF